MMPIVRSTLAILQWASLGCTEASIRYSPQKRFHSSDRKAPSGSVPISRAFPKYGIQNSAESQMYSRELLFPTCLGGGGPRCRCATR